MAEGWAVICSPAIDGQLGCALWLDTERPFIQGDPHTCVARDHLVVLCADARRLFVRLTAPFISLTIAVLHAPYARAAADHTAFPG
eukprot:2827038-Lingulodinium_polyedra.AAC.1